MDKRDLLEGQKRPTTGARRGTRYRQHRSGQYLALRPDAAEEERVEEVHAHAILRHQFACVIHAGRWSARRPPAHAPAPSTPRPLSSIPVPSKAWEWGAMAPAKPRRARLRRLPRRPPVYRVDPFPLRPYRCTQPCLQLHPHQPHSLATVLLWRARHFSVVGASVVSLASCKTHSVSQPNWQQYLECGVIVGLSSGPTQRRAERCLQAYVPSSRSAQSRAWSMSVCV